MAAKVALTYATLVMGYLEDHLYNRSSTIFDQGFSKYTHANWKCHLDLTTASFCGQRVMRIQRNFIHS
jgi:hypothetical protein